MKLVAFFMLGIELPGVLILVDDGTCCDDR